MDIEKRVATVDNLQKFSSEVFNTVIRRFENGMSEADIADMVQGEFKKRGIVEYWYDVQNIVFIGTERFQIGTSTSDYAIKAPSKNVVLEERSVVFIDVSPMDSETKLWGDWASTVIYHPNMEKDMEQISFLKELRTIHRNGLAHITAQTTGADVANYYLKLYKEKGVTLLDARNNVGHSVHEGPKSKAQRIWLDQENIHPLGEGIYAVEPGGILREKDGKRILAGRFEECLYIPREGNAVMLGSQELVSLIV